MNFTIAFYSHFTTAGSKATIDDHDEIHSP